MSSYSTTTLPASLADIPAKKFTVAPLDGHGTWPYAQVTKITYSGDIMVAGTMTVVIKNDDSADQATPITLTNLTYGPNAIKGFSAAIAKDENGQTAFIGYLTKRQESLNGMSITLTYSDARIWLDGIPIRGALVVDLADSKVKLLPGYDAHVNPDGYRNCIEVSSGGAVNAAGKSYVFTPLGEEGTYGIDNDVIGSEPNPSKQAIAWTPDRTISYAWTLTQLALSGTTNYVYLSSFPQLPDNIIFKRPNFAGSKGDVTILNAKMPSVNFKGKTVRNMIHTALEATGGWQFTCKFNGNQTEFVFYPTTQLDATNFQNIIVERGIATDARTVADAIVETDYTQTKPNIILEGNRPQIESQFEWTGVRNTSLLVPMWTPEQEMYFMNMVILAQDSTGTTLGYYDSVNAFKEYDLQPSGDDKDTSVQSDRPALLRLARIAWPRVFSAFKIVDESDGAAGIATIMGGFGGKYDGFPYLQDLRHIKNEQLQPYFETNGEKRGKLRFPIRVSTSAFYWNHPVSGQANGGTMNDVDFNNGLRVEHDGSIFFGGMTDDIQSGNLIYTGSITACTKAGLVAGTISSDWTAAEAGLYPLLKRIRVNLAIAHDTRVFSTASIATYDYNKIKDEIDDAAIGTSSKMSISGLVLNEDGFREEHQVSSYPVQTGTAKIVSGSNQDGSIETTPLSYPAATGISKILHSDGGNAAEAYTVSGVDSLNIAAKRKLRNVAKVKRKQSWDLIGIRNEFTPDMFIEEAIITGSNGGKYKINSPMYSIELDFESQKTVIRPM